MVVVMFLLLTVLVMFFVYLDIPEIETFFAFYTNGTLWFVWFAFGLMKGKHHTEETKQKISKANKGKRGWNKGLKGWLSPEHREAIARSNSTRYNSPETRYKMGSGVRGKPSHRKGKHLSILHRLNIAFGLRESKIFTERVREYHEERVKRFLRGLYDISEDAEFFPASKYEHVFARMVLIEGGVAYGFITHSRLRERPEWITSDRSGRTKERRPNGG